MTLNFALEHFYPETRCLEIRFHENGRLLLTPLANAVLFDDKQVRLATPQKQVMAVKEARTKNNMDSELFQILRELRLVIAKEAKVPAYVVFSDATLKDMEERRPSNKKEFKEVLGVGKVKAERYGKYFLKVIARFEAGDL